MHIHKSYRILNGIVVLINQLQLRKLSTIYVNNFNSLLYAGRDSRLFISYSTGSYVVSGYHIRGRGSSPGALPSFVVHTASQGKVQLGFWKRNGRGALFLRNHSSIFLETAKASYKKPNLRW